jgi:hypothetical protein
MNFTPLEWELLSDVSEDTYGFRELLVTARTLYPTRDEHELLSMTQNAVEKLLRLGLIYVCWFQHTTNNEEIVDSGKATELLRSDSSWGTVEPGTGQLYLAVHATDAGKKTWHAGPSPFVET